MDVSFCSLLLPEEKKLSERSKERLSGISLHKLGSAIIEGLDDNLDKPSTLFNIINTVNYPKFPQIIFKNEKWHHANNCTDYHIGYINLFGIKYITQEYNLYAHLNKWVKKRNGSKCIICVHHIFLPMLRAVVKIKKKYQQQVMICLITGDMTGEFGIPSQARHNIKERLIKRIDRNINALVKEFDCFVFQTKYMAEGFGVENKPYTVMECTYTSPPYSHKYNDIIQVEDKNILFYAGAVRREYGISHLLKAFELIDNSDYELWIAGDGNSSYEVKKYASKDSRIKYLGFISPQEVELCLKKATVIVSPRTEEGNNFVKYSFPSKAMESLASGRPYIAHRLSCDPPEYEGYIIYPKDESDESLAGTIIDICSLSKKERNEIGLKAKEFICKEKNPKAMTKRIVDMWDKMK